MYIGVRKPHIGHIASIAHTKIITPAKAIIGII